ncbi:hypothetical protein [Brevundimonas sp. Root1279]|uniref:hypothetical protein n=1 Tax=Brevundimonas sp. Root1279 TaxID=1736443 RepID=UPI0006FE71A2|nr:hypothetical protein [Brevundimonas sp. Root1279]KQW86787.1 hypothetical protein ASC65_02590 [Brevundimonas sp. Root1279]
MAKKPAPKPKAEDKPPVLEWIMGALGLLIVLGVLGVILSEAFGPRDPAALEARLVEARPSPTGWLAEIEVENAGDETAAQVEIEGRLGAETASATLDYVPARSRERLTLGFDADPRSGLTLHTKGFTEP